MFRLVFLVAAVTATASAQWGDQLIDSVVECFERSEIGLDDISNWYGSIEKGYIQDVVFDEKFLKLIGCAANESKLVVEGKINPAVAGAANAVFGIATSWMTCVDAEGLFVSPDNADIEVASNFIKCAGNVMH